MVVRCAASFLSLALVVQAGDYMHPKLKGKELQLKTFYLLPASVEIARQGVKGAEGMGKESEEAIAGFTGAVSAGLSGGGFTAVSPFTEEALKDKTELKYAVADVQRKFDQIAPQLAKKKKDITKGRFTVGDTVASLNADGKADALVLIRAHGTKNTKGKAFLSGGLLGMALSKPVIYTYNVSVLDAKTGDVLFYGDSISRGVPKDEAFAKLFKKIPRAK